MELAFARSPIFTVTTGIGSRSDELGGGSWISSEWPGSRPAAEVLRSRIDGGSERYSERALNTGSEAGGVRVTSLSLVGPLFASAVIRAIELLPREVTE